ATQGWSHWTDIEDMLPGLYQDYHRRKPIMVAETASVEQGGDKAQWIAHAHHMIENKYPDIAAFVYYNDEDRSQPVYWCIDSSADALSAFRSMARDKYFRRFAN
ncbi:MAG: hypothetical protein ABR600_06360, partial [Actinomycetota bacterium]